MRKELYTAGWLAIGVLGLTLEGLALRDPKRGDTLTEHIRAARKEWPILAWVGTSLWLWSYKHLFLDG